MKFGIVICLFLAKLALSQNVSYPTELTTHFSFKQGKIKDTSELKLLISLKNKSKNNLKVFRSLADGDQFDVHANLFIELEELVNGKYRKVHDKFTDYFAIDSVPEQSYLNLKPGGSAVLRFNLLDRAEFINTGKYKVRFNLLRIPLNDPDHYEMQYTTSKWFYFEIPRFLSRG